MDGAQSLLNRINEHLKKLTSSSADWRFWPRCAREIRTFAKVLRRKCARGLRIRDLTVFRNKVYEVRNICDLFETFEHSSSGDNTIEYGRKAHHFLSEAYAELEHLISHYGGKII